MSLTQTDEVLGSLTIFQNPGKVCIPLTVNKNILSKIADSKITKAVCATAVGLSAAYYMYNRSNREQNKGQYKQDFSYLDQQPNRGRNGEALPPDVEAWWDTRGEQLEVQDKIISVSQQNINSDKSTNSSGSANEIILTGSCVETSFFNAAERELQSELIDSSDVNRKVFANADGKNTDEVGGDENKASEHLSSRDGQGEAMRSRIPRGPRYMVRDDIPRRMHRTSQLQSESASGLRSQRPYSDTRIPRPLYQFSKNQKQQTFGNQVTQSDLTVRIDGGSLGSRIQKRAQGANTRRKNAINSSNQPASRRFLMNKDKFLHGVPILESNALVVLKDEKQRRIRMGTGTLAIVYLCRLKIGLPKGEEGLCILKEFKDNFDQRDFENEVAVLVKMKFSGYTPQLYGVTRTKAHGPMNALILEFLGSSSTKESLTFQKFLKQGFKLAPAQWMQLCYELVKSLDALHGQNIIHGDIKSNNIIIRWQEGRWKPYLIDFGQSTTTDDPYNFDMETIDASKWIVLHPAAAPEVVAGEYVSQASDIYSLAVCLNEAVQKHDLFHLSDIIMCCTDRQPEKRPTTADILMEMEDILEDMSA